MRLHDYQGRRLYLTEDERDRFKNQAEKENGETRTFCHTLLYTGCRPSEALALIPDRFDYSNGAIVFQSLKKRRPDVFRSVPVPPVLFDTLGLVFKLKGKRQKENLPLWTFSRTTAYRKVIEVMKKAEIEGVQATPKGLRHGFGIACVMNNIPLNIIQKWMGHASMSTTAIYANATGDEERQLASKMWG